MSEHVVNAIIRTPFYTGTAGETFTVNRAKYATATDFASLISFSDLGGGDYDLVFTPVVADPNYRARWTSSVTQTPFVNDWAVVTADQFDPVAAVLSAYTTPGTLGAVIASLNGLNTGNVALTTVPIAVNGTISLMQSTDYAASETRSLDWTTSNAGTWPDLTTATILFVAKPQASVTRPGFSISGSVVTPSGATKHVRVEIPAAVTAAVSAGTYDYQVRATFTNTHVVPLASGTLDLTEFLT